MTSPPSPGRSDLAGAPSPLQALWAARGVAVVGASDRPGALGRLPVEFLQRYGYGGAIAPVRPDGAPVAGLASYRSLGQCPPPVDVAMVLVAAERVAGVVRDCGAAGVGTAIVCSSGFAETGEVGAQLQEDLVSVARESGVRIIGPNCIGTVGVGTGQVTSFSPLFSGEATELVPGTLGFVSQSGALGYGTVSLAFERGLGLGWVVNTGNEADVDAAEVIQAIAAEPGCTGILAYVETLTDIGALRQVVAGGTPVALLKAGRSEAGARAAASHTGALATGDRVVDAALRQAGVVRVDDVDELLDIGEVMPLVQAVRAEGGAPGGLRRVAVVTTSGGSGILAADALEAFGLELAVLSEQTTSRLAGIVPPYGSVANPVDVTASVMSNGALFDAALDAIAADPGVDLVLACFCVLTGQDVDDVVASLARAARHSGVPVVAVRTGADHLAPQAGAAMREAGIPCYPTPARAVRAVSALARMARPPTPVPPRPGGATLRLPSSASEQELKDALADAGLAVPTGRLAVSADDAVEAVREAGGRAVLKAVVPGLLHKSEAGGVVLDVTPDEAGQAWERLAGLGGGVLVEEQVSGGVEALVGLTDSPFGTVLTLGVGGVLTEVVADVALRLLPVGHEDVEAMIAETRLAGLLDGIRGAPPADRCALVEAVLTLTAAARDWPAGAELDLNPVTVLPADRGVRILDAALAWAQEGH